MMIRQQEGVVSRLQALDAGLTQSAINSRIRSGRWQRLHDGVYLTSPIPPSFRQRAWAGVLAAGPGAVASHMSAAILLDIMPTNADPITVSVADGRQPRRRAGLIVRRRREVTGEPNSNPPRTDPIDTTLDLVADCRDPGDVASVVIRCFDRGRIRPRDLRARLGERPMQPSRALLLELLESVADGVRSPLEHRYRRDVEIAHGLPHPTRQSARRSTSGWHVRDLEYRKWRLVVELDGRLNHEATERVFRDMDRDNFATLSGNSSLRYGWINIAGTPCRVAEQVAAILIARGWTGSPRRCGAACTLPIR